MECMTVLRKYWALAICVVLVVLRIALGCGMPLCVHAGALYDDAWAVDGAASVAAGEWLGAYDDVTLIKNPGFIVYLALLTRLGIPYLLATTLLNVAAALFLAEALRPLFKRDWTWLLLFALLLFCPVGFATDTFQRIYRNSVTAAQAMLIFGAYLGAYLRIKRAADAGDPLRACHMLPWMLVGAATLAWFWTSREDSIWVAPFVGVATAVMVVLLLRRFGLARRASVACVAACILCLALPLAATAASSTAIKSINEKTYGLATTAEINSGNFARFIKDLYAIEPEVMPENLHVACPHSSVEAAYDVSPTLASIKDQVEERFYNWGDKYDNDPSDGEVNGGEFFWVFRLAGSKAGIYTNATAADEFWGICADEIEAAFAAGKLSQRATMPSSIMSPWRNEYASMLLPAAAGIYAQSCSFVDVTCLPFEQQGSQNEIDLFCSVACGEGYQTGEDIPVACTIGEGAIWIYRILGSALGIAGLVALTLMAVQWLRKRENSAAFLACGAIFLGVLVLIAGLAYTRVSSFTPISYYYYGSAAYPLLLAMNITAITVFAQARLAKETEAKE